MTTTKISLGGAINAGLLAASILALSDEALAALQAHDWPGNVRELRNVIERALILEDNEMITTEYLPGSLLGPIPRDGKATTNQNLATQFALPREGISHITPRLSRRRGVGEGSRVCVQQE